MTNKRICYLKYASAAIIVFCLCCSSGKTDKKNKIQEQVSDRALTLKMLKEAGMENVVAHSGLLRPAAGLAVTDYELFQGVGNESVIIKKDGTFVADVYDGRSAIVFATPKDKSSTSNSLAPQSGIYMTTYAGNQVRLSLEKDDAGKNVYTSATTGKMVLDAVTTVITAVMSHPSLDTKDASIRVEQLNWFCEKLQDGWPALKKAAAAYDAALAGKRNPAEDSSFDSAIAKVVKETLSLMPDYKPPPKELVQVSSYTPILFKTAKQPHLNLNLASFGFSWPWSKSKKATEKEVEKVNMAMASAGKYVSFLELEPVDDVKGTVTTKTWRGTPLDYYFTVKKIDKSKLKPETSALIRPELKDRLPLKGKMVVSGIISAKSMWSYLDVVGGISGWLTSKAGQLSGAMAVPGKFEARAGDVLEIRFFSGGWGYGNSQDIYNHVQQYYSQEAHLAYAHNVAMAVTEAMLLIPGADAIFGEKFGGKVLTTAVTQALKDLQGNAASGSPDSFTKQIMSVCTNAAKAALDEAIKEASLTKKGVRLGWRKLFSFFGKGGRALLKTVGKHLTGGWLSKGGCLVNRAVRMGRPQSILEYHVVQVGGGACLELMTLVMKDEENDLLTPIFCEECLSHSCEAECVEVLKHEKQKKPGDDCSGRCSLVQNICMVELKATTTRCNIACGKRGQAECMKEKGTAANACMTRIGFKCMNECKVTDAMTGKPCLTKMTNCLKQCGASGALDDEPLEALGDCTIKNCKSRCGTKYDNDRNDS